MRMVRRIEMGGGVEILCEVLPSIIGSSTEGEHGLRATVAAGMTAALLDGVHRCSFGLRTSKGLLPLFTSSGDKRNSVMLSSVL